MISLDYNTLKEPILTGQFALAQTSSNGDIALSEGNIPQAIAQYKSALKVLDRELFDQWSHRSPAPRNPATAGLYERLGKVYLLKAPVSEANLTEASKYFQNSMYSLAEYNQRFAQSAITPKQVEITAAALQTECRLVAMTDDALEKRKEHLLAANDLLEELIWIEDKVKLTPTSTKSNNYGSNDPCFIPILKEIAKYQVNRHDNDQFEPKRADGTEGPVYAHRIAISALERVYLMQLDQSRDKKECIETLHELASEYVALHDIQGLQIYISAVQLAGEDKDLLRLIQPPAEIELYLFSSFEPDPDNPQPLNIIDNAMGSYLIQFSKKINKLADAQNSDPVSNLCQR